MVHRLNVLGLVVDGSMVDGLVVDGSMMDGLMVNGLMMNRSMVHRRVVHRSMVHRRVVNRGVVDGPMAVTGTVTRVLLHLGVVVDLLGVGVRLRVNVLGGTAIVGGGHGGESQEGDECLHFEHFWR